VEGAYYLGIGDRSKAIPAFRHAVELDSTNYDAVNSLAVALQDTRDYTGAERTFRFAIKSDPTNTAILSNLAGVYSVSGQQAAFDSMLGVIANSNARFPTAGIRINSFFMRRDYDAAERVARAVADSSKPSGAIFAQDVLVAIAMVQGRLHEAERRYAQVNEAKARLRGDTVSSRNIALFHAMLDGQLRGDSSRADETLDAALRATPAASVPLAQDESLNLAFAYASLGAAAKARQTLSQHEARLDAMGRRQDAVALARTRGMVALAEGRSDSAIAEFRTSDTEADGLPTSTCILCVPLFIGMAFDRSGHADSARAYLTKYVDMIGTGHGALDGYYLGPSLYRLGELYESAGDTKHATEYYGRFVDLWKNADPDLQPRVVEARKRIERMNRATR
jgi:eukaryotic-like serine/threonine-protein kinase